MLDKIWDGVLGVIATVAPGLATCLGGPLAGAAVGAIISALGLPEGTSQDEIVAAIAKADPATLAALKAAEHAFQKDMKALDIDLEKINAGDRDSARNREIQTKDWTPRILLVAMLVIFCAEQAALFAEWMPKDEFARAGITKGLSLVETLLVGAWAYIFGTTTGSRAKTDLLAGMARR